MDEGQFLHRVFPRDSELGGVGAWGWRPEAHLREVESEIEAAIVRERLLSAWAGFWSDDQTFWRVEKTPSNILRTRMLRSVFPGSRFIIVVRHPLTQALAVRKWLGLRGELGLRIHDSVAMWVHCHQLLAADVSGRDDVLVIHYEDMVLRSQDTERLVSEFLGFSVSLKAAAPPLGYWKYLAVLKATLPDVFQVDVPVLHDSNPKGWKSSVRERVLPRTDPILLAKGLRRCVKDFEPAVFPLGYSMRQPERPVH